MSKKSVIRKRYGADLCDKVCEQYATKRTGKDIAKDFDLKQWEVSHIATAHGIRKTAKVRKRRNRASSEMPEHIAELGLSGNTAELARRYDVNKSTITRWRIKGAIPKSYLANRPPAVRITSMKQVSPSLDKRKIIASLLEKTSLPLDECIAFAQDL